MTNQTSEVLDAIENTGLTVIWSERFSRHSRHIRHMRHRTYLAMAIAPDGQQWIVMGHRENEVVGELANQLNCPFPAWRVR